MTHHDDCPHCEDLRERIVWLEDELGWRKDSGRILAMKTAYGLRPKEAAVLDMLYGAKGLPVPRHRLENATLEPGEEETRLYVDNLLSVYITRLRSKVGHETIATLRTRGYALTPEGLRSVRDVLGESE